VGGGTRYVCNGVDKHGAMRGWVQGLGVEAGGGVDSFANQTVIGVCFRRG